VPCGQPTRVIGAVLEYTCLNGHTYTVRFAEELVVEAAGDITWPGSRPCAACQEEAALPPAVKTAEVPAEATSGADVSVPADDFDPILQEDLVMPWGKHKGERLSDIDTGYLQWALQNMDRLAPTYKEEIRNQLAMRRGEGVRRGRR
jgi:hypothetical protein